MCVRDDETAYTKYDKENFVSTVKPKTCQVSARAPRAGIAEFLEKILCMSVFIASKVYLIYVYYYYYFITSQLMFTFVIYYYVVRVT